MNNLNMPLFRAKKINSDEYVVGYYNHTLDNRHIIQTLVFQKQIFEAVSLSWFEEIDPTTLSINFNDMLDSQGNKIFASLNEDGKGGDMVNYLELGYGITFKYIKGMFISIPNSFNQFKVIGIQE